MGTPGSEASAWQSEVMEKKGQEYFKNHVSPAAANTATHTPYASELAGAVSAVVCLGAALLITMCRGDAGACSVLYVLLHALAALHQCYLPPSADKLRSRQEAIDTSETSASAKPKIKPINEATPELADRLKKQADRLRVRAQLHAMQT